MENSAAWLIRQGSALEIEPAPLRDPGADEVVIRTHAVAINPADWIVQSVPRMICPWIKLPFVLGSDVAGEIIAVGADVDRFRLGDRVLGHATGLDKRRNTSADAGFQQFTVLLEHMVSPIPDSMSYEEASVLPLGLSTAACGLFQKDQLSLEHPGPDAQPTGKTLLVWGGSTSVGSNAIQLGRAAGYEVIATASPRNFQYARELGAAAVFDHADPKVVTRLVDALDGKTLAGTIAIGAGSAEPCFAVAARSHGSKNVAIASGPLTFDRIARGASLLTDIFRQTPAMLRFGVAWLTGRTRGVRVSSIWGSSLMHNEVGRLIYKTFLPDALAKGRYRAAPPPIIAGRGLGSIQHALEMQRDGVSAAKIVVSLA